MPAKKRRELTGSFRAYALGGGAWRLERAHPARAEVFLRGVDAGGSGLDRDASVRDVWIEWSREAAAAPGSAMRGGIANAPAHDHPAGTAAFGATIGGRPRQGAAVSAIVHEPLERLYEALPLAEFDAPAQRFWRRVFRLARLPGGRFLLGILARSARKA